MEEPVRRARPGEARGTLQTLLDHQSNELCIAQQTVKMENGCLRQSTISIQSAVTDFIRIKFLHLPGGKPMDATEAKKLLRLQKVIYQ